MIYSTRVDITFQLARFSITYLIVTLFDTYLCSYRFRLQAAYFSDLDSLNRQFQSQVLLLLAANPLEFGVVGRNVLLTQLVDLPIHPRDLFLLGEYVLTLFCLVSPPLLYIQESLLL